MRKLSFLALSFIAMLSFSACTKDAVEQSYNTQPAPYEPQNAYTVSHSEWHAEANTSWYDGPVNPVPNRQTTLSVPMLTQELLDSGSVVLVYAKSNIDDLVTPMPAVYGSASGQLNTYTAKATVGEVVITRTTLEKGAFEMPVDGQEYSFRYIIVTPVTANQNARVPAIADFASLSYEEVAVFFNIPR